jgi:hypothetical protein
MKFDGHPVVFCIQCKYIRWKELELGTEEDLICIPGHHYCSDMGADLPNPLTEIHWDCRLNEHRPE